MNETENDFKIDADEEKKILKKISDFIDNKSDIHSINVTDFKISKNLSSGNGFSVVNKANIWKQERAKVSVNILEPVLNAISFKFTDDPFDFKTEANLDHPELTSILGSTLREICTDGISYVLTYMNEDGSIGFDRLNNFNVLYGDCKKADGADATECLYVDKERIEGNSRASRVGLSKTIQNILNLKQNEVQIMTYWLKTGTDEVTTYEIRGNKITNKVIQVLSRLPVVRFYGKKVWIEYEDGYRGLYYMVKDLLLTMDYEMSLIQEKIATAPTELYIVAQESIGENLQDWTRLNDIPRAFRAYKSYDPKTGREIPAPIPNNYVLNLTEHIESFNLCNLKVNEILGNIGAEVSKNETAEAVLMRRENKNTAVNEMLKNLLDSSHEIAKLITDFSEMPCEITDGIFVKSKNLQDIQNIMMVAQQAEASPVIRAALPLIIKKMDLAPDDITEFGYLLTQAGNIPTQEQVDELTAQLEQLNATLQEKEAQITQLNANVEAQMAKAQIEAQSRIEREMILNDRQMQRLQLDLYKIQMEFGVKDQELNNKLMALQEQALARAEANTIEREKIAVNVIKGGL